MKAAHARVARRRLDAKLAELRPAYRFAPPRLGWLRAVRDALGMPQAELARRLGVTRQAVAQIETAEADGSVRLATLRRAAAALDCDLVYTLVPRTTLDQVVREQAERVVAGEVAAAEQSMVLEAQDSSVDPAAARELADELIASQRLWRS